MGTLPQIDNFAHIGGFFTGIVTGMILMPRITYGKSAAKWNLAVAIFCLPILIVLFVMLLRGYYSDTSGDSQCSWCKYLNCIPGMPWCQEKWAASY
jgi:hypothetical protein